MQSVTIDNLDIKNHVRWANDQQELDPIYIQEAQVVASHPELLGSSIIYSSQWDLLFEWQKRNRPFAHFEPPKKYRLASRRMFSYRILPHMDALGRPDTEEDAVWRLIDLPCFKRYPLHLFEKEKTAVIGLFRSMQFLNSMLETIAALKLKYQKG